MNLKNFLYSKGLDTADKEEYELHFKELDKAFIVYESMEEKEIFESHIRENYTKIKQEFSEYNPIIYSEIPEKSKKILNGECSCMKYIPKKKLGSPNLQDKKYLCLFPKFQ